MKLVLYGISCAGKDTFINSFICVLINSELLLYFFSPFSISIRFLSRFLSV